MTTKSWSSWIATPFNALTNRDRVSDAAERLAQALRDLIEEAVQAAVERDRPALPPAPAAGNPKVPKEDFGLCPWCDKKHMRHLLPVTEALHQLGGISRTTFYALVKEGELSLVKIGRRSFVQAEVLDDFLRRKRYVPGGEGEGTGADRA
jgi:excisionase family DNA binding protein